MRLELREPLAVEGMLTFTAALLWLDDGGKVVDIKESRVVLPGTLDVDRTIEEARARLEEDDFQQGVCFPHDLFTERHRFEPVPLPSPDAPHFAQAIAYPINDLAMAAGYEERLQRVRYWPVEPRTMYFLLDACAAMGSGGLAKFFSEAVAREVVGMLDALDAAGTTRLATLYRRGLGLARELGESEFLERIDEEWLEAEMLPGSSATSSDPWAALDTHDEGGTYWLLQHELEPAFDSYARANVAVLCSHAAAG